MAFSALQQRGLVCVPPPQCEPLQPIQLHLQKKEPPFAEALQFAGFAVRDQ